MTKYILHGGNARHENPDNAGFFREITSGLEGEVKILLNYFSRRDEEDVRLCAAQDKKFFLDNSENKNLVFEVAIPEKLEEQLKNAHVTINVKCNNQKVLDKFTLDFENHILKEFNEKHKLDQAFATNDAKETAKKLGNNIKGTLMT